MQKYYKVVDENLESFQPVQALQYKIGSYIYPTIKESKLFVFDSLEQARNFCCGFRFFIYECDVINPSIADSISCDFFDIEQFWENKRSGCSNSKLSTRPICGTVFCDAVKLNKRVY